MAKRGRKKRDRKHSQGQPRQASQRLIPEALDASAYPRMIVVRLISMRSRCTQALRRLLATALRGDQALYPLLDAVVAQAGRAFLEMLAQLVARLAVHSPSSSVHTSAITAAHSGCSGSTGPTGGPERVLVWLADIVAHDDTSSVAVSD